MKQFFATLPRNVIACFKGRMILWHLIAIALTILLVESGFDWFYFMDVSFRADWWSRAFGPAVGASA